MRKIAALAVALGLFISGASTHMASAHATQHSKSKPAQTQMQTVAYEDTQAPQAAAEPAPAEPADTVVSVVSGDTLSGIADDHSTTYMRLFDANTFINDPDLIYPGDQIRVPGSDEQLTERTEPAQVDQTAYTATDDTSVSDPAPVAAPAPAPEAAPAPQPEQAPETTQVVTQAEAAAGDTTPAYATDQEAKAYIYFHESSNNPDAINYLGCYGLGQDCNGIVRDLCGPDYACQDRFFTNYAMTRYGSWQNALAFWQNNNWW